jgi:Potato inhibitor I family
VKLKTVTSTNSEDDRSNAGDLSIIPLDSPLPIAVMTTSNNMQVHQPIIKTSGIKSWIFYLTALLLMVAAVTTLHMGEKPSGVVNAQGFANINANGNAETDTYVVDTDKTTWPELVGMPGKKAKEIIEKENPNMKIIQIVSKDSMVTMDYRTDRVRIFVEDNEQQTVARPPRAG